MTSAGMTLAYLEQLSDQVKAQGHPGPDATFTPIYLEWSIDEWDGWSWAFDLQVKDLRAEGSAATLEQIPIAASAVTDSLVATDRQTEMAGRLERVASAVQAAEPARDWTMPLYGNIVLNYLYGGYQMPGTDEVVTSWHWLIEVINPAATGYMYAHPDLAEVLRGTATYYGLLANA